LCKKSETWYVFFLCAAAKEKNIKIIFEKNKKTQKKTTTRAKIREKRKGEKRVAHKQKHHCSMHLCD
jgi:hypothetical protein